MSARSKKISHSTVKKQAATWEAKNATLAFHVRKLYELFRAGDITKFKQQLAKFPVPSIKLKEVRTFIAEVNTSVDRGLTKEKLVDLASLFIVTKKKARKKTVVKKTTSQTKLQTNFLPSKELEQRLGAVVLPLLDTQHAQLFVSLLEKEVAEHVWLAFWKQAVPEFVVLAGKIQRALHKEKFDLHKIKKVFMQTKRSVLEVLSPLAKINANVPGYVAVITALGQSAWWAWAESENEPMEAAVKKSVVETVVEDQIVSVNGLLDQLYDDGVFLQVRYRLTVTKEGCTVVFEEDSLVVGFEPSTFLNMRLFLSLSSLQQQRVQSSVETLYVYGRMLEKAEKGSDVARGLKELLKQCAADFSLTYGKNLLKLRR